MTPKIGGYESHMTFALEHAAIVAMTATREGPFCVFSQISGCPLLGPGTYCYLTSYSLHFPEILLYDMQRLERILLAQGVPTLRSKIEHIVYDSKTGVNQLPQ